MGDELFIDAAINGVVALLSMVIAKFAARAPLECPETPILAVSTYGRAAMSFTASYIPVAPTVVLRAVLPSLVVLAR